MPQLRSLGVSGRLGSHAFTHSFTHSVVPRVTQGRGDVLGLTSQVALAKIANLPPVNGVSDWNVVTQFPHLHNNNRAS